MNEMSTTVQEVAANAAKTVRATEESDKQVVHGKLVVGRVIKVMESLEKEIKLASDVIDQL